MENIFKHTPGPWVYDQETNEVRTLKGYYIAYADVDTPGYAEQEIANAKLIAAAPDLLRALISARNELAKHIIFYEYPDLIGPINDAIVKATK